MNKEKPIDTILLDSNGARVLLPWPIKETSKVILQNIHNKPIIYYKVYSI
jgi:hypothetical protein